MLYVRERREWPHLSFTWKDAIIDDRFTGSLTYLLLWPEDGVMKKEDIRCCMDGSIFYRKAEENTRKQQAKLQSKTSPQLIARAKKSI
jgi:hypothetical protein